MTFTQDKRNADMEFFDATQSYLLKRNGNLNELQKIKFEEVNPNSIEAKKLFLRCLSSANIDNDQSAMASCSAFFRTGWGTKSSPALALEYAHKAAKNEFALGLTQLAICYQQGVGIEADILFARNLFEKAAALGHSVAALTLAIEYESNVTESSSAQNALKFAQIAYELGDPFAAYLIGSWHERSSVVNQDITTAIAWYKKGADAGSRMACIRLIEAQRKNEFDLSADADKIQFWYAQAERGYSL
jgi:uncharacterized protein